jgi:hypothetical protein
MAFCKLGDKAANGLVASTAVRFMILGYSRKLAGMTTNSKYKSSLLLRARAEG